MNSTVQERRGFTLIELLVVIAIIAILAAILFPVFAKARERARTTQTISNMRQIGIAVMAYADDNDGTFPKNRDYTGLPNWTWKRAIQPYLKSYDVWLCPSVKSPWTLSPINGSPGDESNIRPEFYKERNTWLPASYAYSGGFFHELSANGRSSRARKQSDLKDPSNVIFVLNSRLAYPDLGPWTMNWRITNLRNYQMPVINSGGPTTMGIGPFVQHAGRVPMIMADGHVVTMKMWDTVRNLDMWRSGDPAYSNINTLRGLAKGTAIEYQ